jgi:hypothetical protein
MTHRRAAAGGVMEITDWCTTIALEARYRPTIQRFNDLTIQRFNDSTNSNCNFGELWEIGVRRPGAQAIQYDDITSQNLLLFRYQHFATDCFGSSK